MPYEKVGKNDPVCIVDELPFDIPDSWAICRFSLIATMINGRAYKQNELLSAGKYPVLRVGNLFTNSSWYYSDLELDSDKYCEKDDLLYAWSASFGPFIWNGDKCIFHYHIWKVDYTSAVTKKYLYYLLLAETNRIKGQAHGVSMMHVTKEGMESRLVCIPPLAEQHRIVAKIEELLPHIEDYDRAEQKLDKLNTEFPEQLKKSILQWAIQGKLLPQNPDDEPASVLLERIRAEKARLVKDGKIKKDKHESVIFRRDNSHYEKRGSETVCIDDEIPFDIPETWQWVKLSTIAKQITDGEHKTPRRVANFQGYYLLSARNIRDGFIALENVDYVDKNEYELISRRCNPQKGDILISCSGSVGRVCVVEDNGRYVMVRSAAMISPLIMYSHYLMYALQSDAVQRQIQNKIKQAVQANLFQGAIRELYIPIPPLTEQKQICNALNKIFPVVSTL